MIASINIKKPMLLDFFEYLFPKENGVHIISSTKDIGKFLISRVSCSNLPIKSKLENSIKIKLPKTDNTTAHTKYLYYTAEDLEKINKELEAVFNINFDTYYLQGKKMGFTQKEIISSYILSRNLVSLNGDIEMLKKRIYREDIKNTQKVEQYFKNRCYQRHNIIENSIKNLASTY